MTTRDDALRFLDTRIAHWHSCRECSEGGWVGYCGWNDPDPLAVDAYVPGDELAYSTPHRIPWRWLALALVLLIAWRKLL